MIYTDDNGRPINKPDRADYVTDCDYVEAFYAWKRKRESLSWTAFDDAFRAAMKRGTP